MEEFMTFDFGDDEDIKSKFDVLEEELNKNGHIDPNLYLEYDVKRGLRDSNGKGVLTGLTEISDVCGYSVEGGRLIPSDGRLYYQGINVADIVNDLGDRRYGFEETIYLLLFGKLPTRTQLENFISLTGELMSLDARFVRDVVMKASNANIMNSMQRCVLSLFTYDNAADDVTVHNVLRQSSEIICKLPVISV